MVSVQCLQSISLYYLLQGQVSSLDRLKWIQRYDDLQST